MLHGICHLPSVIWHAVDSELVLALPRAHSAGRAAHRCSVANRIGWMSVRHARSMWNAHCLVVYMSVHHMPIVNDGSTVVSGNEIGYIPNESVVFISQSEPGSFAFLHSKLVAFHWCRCLRAFGNLLIPFELALIPFA